MDCLIASILFGFRIALLGAVAAPGTLRDGTKPGMHWLAGWGRIVCVGLVLNLLLILLAAQCGIWTPLIDWLVWFAVVAIGAALRRLLQTSAWRSAALLWGAATSVLVGLAMMTPLRSEWLAGGWDPGVYQNESLAIARLDGLKPDTDTVYALMTPEQRVMLVRSSPGYNEVLPSLPIDMETGALGRYFFPMTPLMGALMSRLGGIDMLCRLGTILGVLSVPAFWWLLCALGLPGRQRVASIVVWCLVPMAWYQGAIPTSEHLQILLLLSATALYVEAVKHEQSRPLLLGCVLFAAVTNRFAFAALCAVMFPVCAMADALAGKKGFRGRWWVCFLALTSGIFWDFNFCSQTLVRLQDKDNAIVLVTVPCMVGLLFAQGIARIPFARLPVARLGTAAGILFAMVTAALGIVCILFEVPALRPSIWSWSQESGMAGSSLQVLLRVSLFGGTYGLIVAFLAAAWLAFDRTADTRGFRAVVLAFAGALLLLMINPAVADLYPWALRRYLEYMLPLIALLGGYGVWRVLKCVPLKSIQTIGLSVVLVAWAALSVRQYHAALLIGDYVGISAVLANIRAHIPENAIVIADDARWGTPLALQDGTDVINGRLLWTQTGGPGFDQQNERLDNLTEIAKAAGRDLVWLTSTDSRLGFYEGLPISNLVQIAELGTFDYRTVIHSKNADHFATAPHTAVFTLYKGGAESSRQGDRASESDKAD